MSLFLTSATPFLRANLLIYFLLQVFHVRRFEAHMLGRGSHSQRLLVLESLRNDGMARRIRKQTIPQKYTNLPSFKKIN